MLTVPATINPEKKPAVGSRPGSILTFQDLRLTSTLLGQLPKGLGHRAEVITEAYVLYSTGVCSHIPGVARIVRPYPNY